IPYDFSDLVFRVDGRLDGGWGFEVSSIAERDHVRGDIPGLIRDNRGRWGNRAGRVSLLFPVGRWQGSLTAGQTLFGTRIRREAQTGSLGGERTISLPSLRNSVQHQTLGVQLQSGDDEAPRWAAGVQ